MWSIYTFYVLFWSFVTRKVGKKPVNMSIDRDSG